ncbi:MAG: hypothetical protein ACD_36C00015G0003 [uncultured bacterium]|nr:MAG: hypothetical protein ACD_36C00015G0003 [uncultured bacterium]
MIDFLKRITVEAGELIERTERTKAKDKGVAGWATEADFASEEFLMSQIHKQFPSHKILSEETENTLEDLEKEPHLWVIDPVDGTTNFSFHIPFYCISAGYMENGKTIAGAVYDPSRNELFWAEDGKGAFMNTTRLTIDQQTSFKGKVACVGFWHPNKKDFRVTQKIYKQGAANIVSHGSAALSLSYIAAGRLFLFYQSTPLHAWDVAAAQLVIEEAGGKFFYEGSYFSPHNIIAGNQWGVDQTKHILHI